MQRAIRKLVSVGSNICYMDTGENKNTFTMQVVVILTTLLTNYANIDSLVFVIPKSAQIPLPISTSVFGAFKHELGEDVEIVEFQSLG